MHLLATHFYHHQNPRRSTNLFHWDSDTTLNIRITIHHAIAAMTHQITLPCHAVPLIHLPSTLGGLGIRDPISATIPSYITTITRTLHYVMQGIPIHNTQHCNTN
jgi:hypothetical protein